MDSLRQIIRECPLIDNHAHNLLLPNREEEGSFLSITSEARGEALSDVVHSLSHIRAAAQLRELYNLKDGDWEAILAAREEWSTQRHEQLLKTCFQGCHTILMDDGLDSDSVYPYDWHDQYTEGSTRRIVRIESVAEEIVHKQFVSRRSFSFEDFESEFEESLAEALSDDKVAGFKSVICYRSGLKIEDDETGAMSAFNDYTNQIIKDRGDVTKIREKRLNDWLVFKALDVISLAEHAKPIQFHTGLGDNDLTLSLSDPSHLQRVFELFPRVPFVLLHSSYPFTRAAGYLASVYKNVYLDIGEVYPMLSRDGEEAVLRQVLELVPGNKVLWSTDGHWFAETYWLANKQFRSTVEKVLVEYVERGDMTLQEAADLVPNILFNNSNQLYNLGLPPQSSVLAEVGKDARTMVLAPQSPSAMLQAFEQAHPDLSYVYIQWMDYMGTMRAHIFPIKEFRLMCSSPNSPRLSISRGNTGTLQNDSITTAVNTTGVIHVTPDLTSLRPTHRLDTLRRQSIVPAEQRSSATVMAGWLDDDYERLPACPRGALATLVETMKSESNADMLMGFELEVTFLRRVEGGYKPLTTNHAWSTLSTEQWQNLDLLTTIVDGLVDIGVEVSHFHAEAGPGQFEIILPPSTPLHAIDTLYQARQVIFQTAARHSLRATFHSAPVPGAGTGAHTHISISPPSKASHFFAGVEAHLRAICALTLPEAESYARVVDDCWSGGRWVAWGTQNREVPLRRVEEKDGHWEIKCVDGFANMYLGMAGVVGAGLAGLRMEMEMKSRECVANPSRLTEGERSALGITKLLPVNIGEALAALDGDLLMKAALGKSLVEDYIVMKRTEQEMLGKMSEEERHAWLIERY